ncbi:alpha/beta hydrolase [Roseiconus nitratireducens]|uniref:Alpha/beta hydrolase n=1 Tax=Roseiconus nitratireducens TaxID=2605748 RepID=A0A5M6D1P5_9BACT|nr:alpha/beta fold hydrolase [Roseiconus nitratireducens]KAA5540936.1 alpha/beta hydrolase [Roseiconus nitratireducens]
MDRDVPDEPTPGEIHRVGFFQQSLHSLRGRVLDRFVLRPSRHHLPFEPKRRELIPIGEKTMECFVQDVFPGSETSAQDATSEEPPGLVVLKFPGTAGRGERSTEAPAHYLPEVRSQVWTWNPPGYGSSRGRASLRILPQHAQQFYQHVRERFDATTRIWLVGNSLGCATAVALASLSHVEIDGLILRNPPPLVETVKRVSRRYPLGHLTDPIAESLPDEMNLLRTASRVRTRTVMLQSELDRLVPAELQMQVYHALPPEKRLVILRGLDHDGVVPEDQEDEVAAAVRWLWESQR